MSLKRAALEILGREQLAWYAEAFGVAADRRSRSAMVNALLREKSVTAASILEPMGEADIKSVCEAVGLSSKGRRGALYEKLLVFDAATAQAKRETRAPAEKAVVPAPSPGKARRGVEAAEPAICEAPTFVAIDFETADYERDSACAVALVRVEGGRITERAVRYIRPPRRDFVFTYIHGITWSRVKGEPPFAQVWPELHSLLEGARFLAAHNASFDRRVLEACCEAARLQMPALPFECTMKLARKIWNLRPTTLPDVCRHLRIPLNHHDAASDAEACARIVLAARSTLTPLPAGR